MPNMVNTKLKAIDSNYILILITSILLCSPLYVDGLFKGHDLDIHIYRIIGTVKALLEFQFPPLLSPDFSGGFGYAWNIFYAPLSAYIPAIIKIFVPTFIGSFKIFVFLTVIFSGITMYHFVKEYTNSLNIGVLASILYMTAPYRLVDIYIRGAMGEVLAFVFIPILFHGLYNLIYGNKQKSYLLTIGGAGLILSHNISALICVIFSIMYLILNIKKINLKIIKHLSINGLFIVGITSFFIVPLLEQKLLGNYLVFVPGRMGSINFLEQNVLYLHQLIFGIFQQGGSYLYTDISKDMPFMIGLQVLMPIFITPIIFNRLNNQKYNYVIFLFFGLFAAYATTNLFPWGSMPGFFSFIQFPWRLLMISIFFLSIISARNMAFLIKKMDWKYNFIFLMVIIIYISPLLSVTNFDPTITDSSYSNTSITKENLEYSGDRASNEYLPVNTFNNLEYFINRSKKIEVKSGDIDINAEEKSGSAIKFSYSSKKDSVVELPFLYYIGWNIKYHQTKNQDAIHIIETDKGFVGLEIPGNTNGDIEVEFSGTTLAKIAYFFSVFTILVFISYVLIFRSKTKTGIE